MKSLLFLLSAIVLSSCHIYHSDVPLGKTGKEELPDNLLGKWYLAALSESGFEVMTSASLYKLHDKSYVLNFEEYKNKGREIDRVDLYQLDPITINKHKYLNLKQLSQSAQPHPYTIWKYEMMDDTHANVRYLTDTFTTQFDNGKKFAKHVKANQIQFNSFFTKKHMPYTRAHKITWDFANHNKVEDLMAIELLPSNVSKKKMNIFTDDQLALMSKGKNKSVVSNAKEVLQKTHFIEYRKMARFKTYNGFFKFKGDKIIRIEISQLKGRRDNPHYIVHDLTNDWWYSIPNEVGLKWESVMEEIKPLKMQAN